jgi:hypothetical protein
VRTGVRDYESVGRVVGNVGTTLTTVDEEAR